MTAVGINDILVTNLKTIATGAALDYADTTAFLAASWNLTAIDEDGVDLDPQPTWSLVRSDTDGDHQFIAEVFSGAYRWKLTVPSGKFASVTNWTGRGTGYGLDDLGGMVAAAGTITISPTATTASATWYDGDSLYVPGLLIPDAALTAIGASSLADCDDIFAFIKQNSLDSNDEPDVDETDDLTVTPTTDTSGNRIVAVSMDTFPAALGVPDDANQVATTMMIQVAKGTKKIIACVVALTVQWVSDQGDFAEAP